MKFVALVLITWWVASAQSGKDLFGIEDNYFITNPDGSYVFRTEQADGTVRYENGYYETVTKDSVSRKALVQEGYFSYQLPTFHWRTVYYRANATGFHILNSSTTLIRAHLPANVGNLDELALNARIVLGG